MRTLSPILFLIFSIVAQVYEKTNKCEVASAEDKRQGRHVFTKVAWQQFAENTISKRGQNEQNSSSRSDNETSQLCSHPLQKHKTIFHVC
jgi:hypothetical protein